MDNILFKLGQTVITQGAAAEIERLNLQAAYFFYSHSTGNFGTAGDYHKILPTVTEQEFAEGALATSDDGKLNVIAIKNNSGRVMSYYETNGTVI
jgi:hypothetical protein